MHWYTMRSKPNKEMALSHELSARQVEVFYPQLRVRPVNPRSRTVQPYFPGYLFVHVDLEQIGFSELHRLPFSLGLLSFGGEAPAVPELLIHGIQRRVEEINAAGGRFASPRSVVDNSLRQGEAVVILDGPFAGHEAIFDECVSGSERVRVLLKLLNRRQLPLMLPTEQIKLKNRH